jgi:DNA-directed RNA polymerase alpha subunit
MMENKERLELFNERKILYETLNKIKSTIKNQIYDLENKIVKDPIFGVKVDELELSLRSMNCLKNNNIVYIGDLVGCSDGELLRSPNFGKKSLREVKEILKTRGLELNSGLKFSRVNGRPYV